MPTKETSTKNVLAQARISFSGDARISRQELAQRLRVAGLGNLDRTPGNEGLVLPRNDADAIRTGISQTLGGSLGTFRCGEIPCKVISAPAKSPVGTLKLDVHLQSRETAVTYGLVGTLEFVPSKKGQNQILAFTPGDAWDKIPPGLQARFRTPASSLLEFGKNNLFDKDLHSVVKALTASIPKFIPGTWLLHDPAQLDRIMKIKDCLARLDHGKATLFVVHLEQTGANKEVIFSEVDSIQTEKMRLLLEASEKDPEMWRTHVKAYTILADTSDSIASSLGGDYGTEYYTLAGELSERLMKLQQEHQNKAA